MLNYLFKDSKKQSVFVLLLTMPLFYLFYVLYESIDFTAKYLFLIIFIVSIRTIFSLEMKNLMGRWKLISIKKFDYFYLIFPVYFVLIVITHKDYLEETMYRTTIIAISLIVLLYILIKRSYYLIVNDEYIKYVGGNLEHMSKIKWEAIQNKSIEDNILIVKSNNREIIIDLNKITQEDKQYLLAKLDL